MYDKEGALIVAYKDKHLKEVFGTQNSKSRKPHHRKYLRYFIRDTALYSSIQSVFANDELYKQYMRLATPKYQKQMIGRIVQDLVKASLLHFKFGGCTYESLLSVQVLFLRSRIYKKVYGLKNNGYTDELPIKINVPKQKLERMGQRLADILEPRIKQIYQKFLDAEKAEE